MQDELNNKTLIDINEHLKRESIFRIGIVHSVSGRTIKVEVFKNKNHPYLIYDGKITKNVATGSYIKIKKGLTTIIGKIEGEEIEENNYFNDRYGKEEVKIKRFLNVSLFGHYESGKFYQGIKELPLIDNECYVLEEEDFIKLHNFFKKRDLTIKLGKLSEDPSSFIKVSVDKLFASHIGIFGNTGSGKSNTLARIYTELFKKAKSLKSLKSFKQNSRFLFIDFNGEYTRLHVLSKEKKIFNLNTRKVIERITEDERYAIDAKVLEDAEILSVLLHATEKTQKPFLSTALQSAFLNNPENYVQSVKTTIKNIIDRAQPGTKEDIINLLEVIKSYSHTNSAESCAGLISNIQIHLTQIATGSFRWDTTYDKSNGLNIWSQHIEPTLNNFAFQTNLDAIDKLQLRIYLHYYFRISISGINADYIEPLINRMGSHFKTLKKVICIKEELPEQNIIVVSLRNVKLEMKKILPLVICKHLYEIQKIKNDEKEKIESSLHIVIDEAHNILSEESERESELWKDYRLETFEEIIKEGRKFGTFLTVASQRPYDISQTIISQLHNYFIHRLINNNDLNAIRKAVAYLDDLSFDTIPILSVGSCFFAGLATDIPIKINIELLEAEKQTRSETIKLTDAWSRSANPIQE